MRSCAVRAGREGVPPAHGSGSRKPHIPVGNDRAPPAWRTGIFKGQLESQIAFRHGPNRYPAAEPVEPFVSPVVAGSAGTSRSADARPAPLDRVLRVVVARRRGVPGRHQAVDQRLVLGGKGIV